MSHNVSYNAKSSFCQDHRHLRHMSWSKKPKNDCSLVLKTEVRISDKLHTSPWHSCFGFDSLQFGTKLNVTKDRLTQRLIIRTSLKITICWHSFIFCLFCRQKVLCSFEKSWVRGSRTSVKKLDILKQLLPYSISLTLDFIWLLKDAIKISDFVKLSYERLISPLEVIRWSWMCEVPNERLLWRWQVST